MRAYRKFTFEALKARLLSGGYSSRGARVFAAKLRSLYSAEQLAEIESICASLPKKSTRTRPRNVLNIDVPTKDVASPPPFGRTRDGTVDEIRQEMERGHFVSYLQVCQRINRATNLSEAERDMLRKEAVLRWMEGPRRQEPAPGLASPPPRPKSEPYPHPVAKPRPPASPDETSEATPWQGTEAPTRTAESSTSPPGSGPTAATSSPSTSETTESSAPASTGPEGPQRPDDTRATLPYASLLDLRSGLAEELARVERELEEGCQEAYLDSVEAFAADLRRGMRDDIWESLGDDRRLHRFYDFACEEAPPGRVPVALRFMAAGLLRMAHDIENIEKEEGAT
jgi:hypothetical protein